MKILAVLAVFVGIPSLFVLAHSSARSQLPEEASPVVSISSYDEDNIEKCFFWTPESIEYIETTESNK
jgi:hypothetical protein